MLISTITTQRSGSKLLAGCFNSGLLTRSFGEVFNPDDWRHLGNFHQYVRAIGQDWRNGSSEFTLDEFFYNIKLVSSSIIHFDIMFNQIEIPCFSWNSYNDHFIYGYLKSRKSVVISLERDPFSSYVSGKYLELVQQKSHLLDTSKSNEIVSGLALDYEDYINYRKGVLRNRRELYEAMSDYPYFFICRYDDILQKRWIPEDLCSLIDLAAGEHGLRTNRDLIQLIPAPSFPSGIDYTKAFVNFSEIESMVQGREGLG